MNRYLSFLILIVSSTLCHSQDSPFDWLEGRWVGDGFGGSSEEVWSAPSDDGIVMGMYRHLKADGSLNFYEMFLLDSTGLRLKHFTPDFVGWEEKSDYLTFEMVEISEKKISLKGLTYELVGEDEMKISLKMNYNGKIETEVFNMKKIN